MILKYLCFILTITLTKGDKVWHNGMFKIPDLRDICHNFKEVGITNTECSEQLSIICENKTLLLTSK